MSWSLDEIISQISAEVDQTSTNPANTGVDYAQRRTFVNRALRDYSESYDWEHRIREVNTTTSNLSASVGGLATIAMPNVFRKLAGFPKISWSTDQTNEFGEIDVATKDQYLASDKFVYFLRSGATVNMIVHSSIVSGASIYFAYYSSPASLASPVDVADIPDPTYLAQRALYYIYKSTEDGRFIDALSMSDEILRRMIENEVSRGVGYQNDRVKTHLETKHGFRIGRD